MEGSEVLHQYGVSVYKMITEGPDNQFDSALNSFVCITAIQVKIFFAWRDSVKQLKRNEDFSSICGVFPSTYGVSL